MSKLYRNLESGGNSPSPTRSLRNSAADRLFSELAGAAKISGTDSAPLRISDPLGGIPTVLIAEDDENDITLWRRAFAEAQVATSLKIVRDGAQAIQYLSGKGAYSDRNEYPWPSLMLLDLKMPQVDGFEVLDWWHRQENRSELVILVMSSCRDEGHIQKAMDLGAVGYRVKPSGFDYLVCVARELGQRWLA